MTQHVDAIAPHSTQPWCNPMGISSGRRVTTKEVAGILGVPVHLITRLDVAGRWIKRFKLTRKTHVYDIQSLYAYLESCQSKPSQKISESGFVGRSSASSTAKTSVAPSFSLKEFLSKKLKEI